MISAWLRHASAKILFMTLATAWACLEVAPLNVRRIQWGLFKHPMRLVQASNETCSSIQRGLFKQDAASWIFLFQSAADSCIAENCYCFYHYRNALRSTEEFAADCILHEWALNGGKICTHLIGRLINLKFKILGPTGRVSIHEHNCD